MKFQVFGLGVPRLGHGSSDGHEADGVGVAWALVPAPSHRPQ